VFYGHGIVTAERGRRPGLGGAALGGGGGRTASGRPRHASKLSAPFAFQPASWACFGVRTALPESRRCGPAAPSGPSPAVRGERARPCPSGVDRRDDFRAVEGSADSNRGTRASCSPSCCRPSWAGRPSRRAARAGRLPAELSPPRREGDALLASRRRGPGRRRRAVGGWRRRRRRPSTVGPRRARPPPRPARPAGRAGEREARQPARRRAECASRTPRARGRARSARAGPAAPLLRGAPADQRERRRLLGESRGPAGVARDCISSSARACRRRSVGQCGELPSGDRRMLTRCSRCFPPSPRTGGAGRHSPAHTLRPCPDASNLGRLQR
jgi:hypothetical protein